MTQSCQHHYQFLLKPNDSPGHLIQQLNENPYGNPITYTVSATRKLLYAIYSGQIRVTPECFTQPPLAWLEVPPPEPTTQPVDIRATHLLQRLVNEPLTQVQGDLMAYTTNLNLNHASPWYPLSMRYALHVFTRLPLNYLEAVTVNIALAITAPIGYGQSSDNPFDRLYTFDLQTSKPYQPNPLNMAGYEHTHIHQAHFGPEWMVVPYRVQYDNRPSITVTLDMVTGIPAERGHRGGPSNGLLLIPALLFWHSAQLRSSTHG